MYVVVGGDGDVFGLDVDVVYSGEFVYQYQYLVFQCWIFVELFGEVVVDYVVEKDVQQFVVFVQFVCWNDDVQCGWFGLQFCYVDICGIGGSCQDWVEKLLQWCLYGGDDGREGLIC